MVPETSQELSCIIGFADTSLYYHMLKKTIIIVLLSKRGLSQIFDRFKFRKLVDTKVRTLEICAGKVDKEIAISFACKKAPP